MAPLKRGNDSLPWCQWFLRVNNIKLQFWRVYVFEYINQNITKSNGLVGNDQKADLMNKNVLKVHMDEIHVINKELRNDLIRNLKTWRGEFWILIWINKKSRPGKVERGVWIENGIGIKRLDLKTELVIMYCNLKGGVGEGMVTVGSVGAGREWWEGVGHVSSFGRAERTDHRRVVSRGRIHHRRAAEELARERHFWN